MGVLTRLTFEERLRGQLGEALNDVNSCSTNLLELNFYLRPLSFE